MTAQWENELLAVERGKAEFHLEFPKGKSKGNMGKGIDLFLCGIQ